MIHLVVALLAEAKPLLSYFKLKPVSNEGSFKLYERDRMNLIISGPGKKRAQAAVEYLHDFSGGKKNDGWLNVGIGGHATHSLGAGFLAHKVTDGETGRSWYPPLVIDLDCETISVCTVKLVENVYSETCVYEMEASGFYGTAAHFSTAELVHCFKVVSDNGASSSRRVSGRMVEDLIGKNVGVIECLLQRIDVLSAEVTCVGKPPKAFEFLSGRWHFTVTEKRQLNRLLKRLETLGVSVNELEADLESSSSAKRTLSLLEERIQGIPMTL